MIKHPLFNIRHHINLQTITLLKGILTKNEIIYPQKYEHIIFYIVFRCRQICLQIAPKKHQLIRLSIQSNHISNVGKTFSCYIS